MSDAEDIEALFEVAEKRDVPDAECPGCGQPAADASRFEPSVAVCETDGCFVDSWDTETDAKPAATGDIPLVAGAIAAGTIAMVVGWWVGVWIGPEPAVVTSADVVTVPRGAVSGSLAMLVLGTILAWHASNADWNEVQP